MKRVVTSGYFDPLHVGHLECLELAKKLKVGTDDLLAACALLEIPATSRISCLTHKQIKKLIDYHQK